MALIFSIFWECHHPNWPIFFRGVETTNQLKNTQTTRKTSGPLLGKPLGPCGFKKTWQAPSVNELLGQLRRVGKPEEKLEEIWLCQNSRYTWKKMIYVICLAILVEKEVIIYWNEVYHHFKTKQLFSPVAKGLGLYFLGALSLVKSCCQWWLSWQWWQWWQWWQRSQWWQW